MRKVFGKDAVSATGWLLPMQGTKAPMDAVEAANKAPVASGAFR